MYIHIKHMSNGEENIHDLYTHRPSESKYFVETMSPTR